MIKLNLEKLVSLERANKHNPIVLKAIERMVYLITSLTTDFDNASARNLAINTLKKEGVIEEDYDREEDKTITEPLNS